MEQKNKYHEPTNLSLKGVKLDANIFFKEKSEAEYNLGQLQGSGGDGLGKRFFNPELLLSPLSTKEAVLSSRIEGTISTVSDVYKYEAGQTPEFSGTEEVWNYRKAIYEAIDLVRAGKKMNKTYLKGLHRILLSGVRHRGTLGDFRKKDVWLGKNENDPIEKAIYVPPMFDYVESHIDNLFEYIEKGTEDALTKAALVHYQFEAIHPFEDGNGRVGRLLIPLILFENKRMSLPILYMSGYFDSHGDEYRVTLHEVDITGKYEEWLKFFFRSVAEQAKQTLDLISEINKLYEETYKKVEDSRLHYLIPFLALLFENPVFYPTEIEKKLKATYPSVSGLIKLFEDKGIIKQIDSNNNASDKRIKLYSFTALIKLLSS